MYQTTGPSALGQASNATPRTHPSFRSIFPTTTFLAISHGYHRSPHPRKPLCLRKQSLGDFPGRYSQASSTSVPQHFQQPVQWNSQLAILSVEGATRSRRVQ